MTKTTQKPRSHEVDRLRKEVERLTAALAAIKNQKDAYVLEVRKEDGESFSITRTYYHAKKDAVNDLLLERTKFAGDDKELQKIEPRQVTRGNTELTISTDDKIFRGTISRIKII
jgi:hypothetical protein